MKYNVIKCISGYHIELRFLNEWVRSKMLVKKWPVEITESLTTAAFDPNRFIPLSEPQSKKCDFEKSSSLKKITLLQQSSTPSRYLLNLIFEDFLWFFEIQFT